MQCGRPRFDPWVGKIPWVKGMAGYSFNFMANEETVETVTDFVLGSSKITADGDCSHEIKRRFLEEKV